MSHKEIYIIDDDIAVRDSLSFLLETHGFRVTAFENGDLFLETDLSHYHAPILLDVRMPGRDGLEVLKIALEKNPKLNFIMMSGHADISMAVRALKLGAVDFIEKPFQGANILSILERLTSEEQTSQASPEQQSARDQIEKLTKRETEISALLVDGKANKEIANTLEISVRTVETHRAHIMSKLDIKSLSDLVKIWLNAE